MGSSKQNQIDHVAIVLDMSYSMMHLRNTVIKVADELIQHLAAKSKEMDREVRVTVYTFADLAKCVVFDKDVLRLPSVKEFYVPGGNTALIDAAMLSVLDLRETMVKYGDHAFLTYILTDGEENRSQQYTPTQLQGTMASLRENETVAVLVPNDYGVNYARHYGFPEGNITKWEVSTEGLQAAATKITRSVDTYMENRVLGVRSTKAVFSTDTAAVNKATVNAKKLVSLARTDYTLFDVKQSSPTVIKDFVEAQGETYNLGKAFYQLTKTEVIQKSKGVAIQNKHSGRVYSGQQARDVLGLPDLDARVKPDSNDEYRIYVQSTSVNRKLVPGTKLLLMK